MTVKKATHEEEAISEGVIKAHIQTQLSPDSDRLRDLIKEHYKCNAVFKIPVVPQVPCANTQTQRSGMLDLAHEGTSNEENSSESIDKVLSLFDEVWEEATKETDAKSLAPEVDDTPLSRTNKLKREASFKMQRVLGYSILPCVHSSGCASHGCWAWYAWLLGCQATRRRQARGGS